MAKRLNDIATRIFNIALVGAASPVWLMLYAFAALAVRISMGSPVHFTQLRAGFNGKPFKMRKLRTMRDSPGSDAERLTSTGRILRSLSLDELPQLVHVLKGDMSLVGPRPLPVMYLPRYTLHESRRHEVRPGITGWAQVHGRNTISWRRKFALDIWYVDHQSLALDVWILILTVLQVFRRSEVHSATSATMEEFKGLKTTTIQ